MIADRLRKIFKHADDDDEYDVDDDDDDDCVVDDYDGDTLITM